MPPLIGENVISPAADPGTVTEGKDQDIYFISGLGADERVFQWLEIQGFNPVHIRWERPQRGETLEHYAQRLLSQVRAEHPILVGLSFGGLVAVEMAKQCQPAQVILLSSAKTAAEIPIYFKLFRWLPVQRIIPFKQFLWAVYGVINWLFGLDVQTERDLLKQILIDTDPGFLRWAMECVVTWRNQEVPDNLVHIHGGRDRVFPLWFLHPDIVIPDGGHLMVVNRAKKISALLAEVLTAPSGPL